MREGRLCCIKSTALAETDMAHACTGAYHSLQRLGQSCELLVVTSRQHCIRGPTLAWVEQHFPGVFAEVHFGNHWALEGTSKAKSEICRCPCTAHLWAQYAVHVSRTPALCTACWHSACPLCARGSTALSSMAAGAAGGEFGAVGAVYLRGALW